jgi:hypothetical protein
VPKNSSLTADSAHESDGRTVLVQMLHRPRLWLGAQLVLIVTAAGLFGLWTPRSFPDTGSYIETAHMPFGEALCSYRTLGYPMFLRLSAAVAPQHRAVPLLQLSLLCIAVYFVDSAVRRFGASPWRAFAFSSGFMYGTLQQPWTIAAILTDFPGVIVAGTAAACVFWVAGERKSWLGWCLLTFTLAASYHIRPAYLFMVVLVPCLGALLWFYSAVPGRRQAWKWFLAALVGVAILPLLAYCSLRLLLVNDFGLVSFGGDTSSALAAELLDWPMINNELPTQCRPLAAAVLQERQRQGVVPAFRGGTVSLSQYENNFSPNVYRITYPEAIKLYGTDQPTLNRELRRYSRAVIGLRKGKYLLWAAYMLPRTAAKVLYRAWFLWIFAPVATLMVGLRLWITRHRLPSSLAGEGAGVRDSCGHDDAFLLCTCLLAALFYCGLVAVLILAGSYADSRLVVPGALFLPSVLLLVILREYNLIRMAVHLPQ